MAGKIIGALIIALIISGLIGATYYYKNAATEALAEAAKEKAEKLLVIKVNEEQEKAMKALQEQTAKDNVILAKIFREMDEINNQQAATTEAVTELKESNEDVKAYLINRVPDSLRLQLNR